jgi:hypothetical protein
MGTVVDPAIIDYLTQAGRQAGRQADRQVGSGQVGRLIADR